MLDNIDDHLIASFTSERVLQAYKNYKLAKWDHFSGLEDPVIKIPMGADGVKYEAFEKQLHRNIKNICQRVVEDRYIFYPLREREIEKEPVNPGKDKKYRTLSIASIRDVLVQTILYENVLYQPIEKIFSQLDRIEPVSFAYRKGKSAPKAAEKLQENILSGYHYVFDADLSKFFDTIPHDELLKRLANAIGGNTSRTYKLVRRFISTDKVPYFTYRNARRKGKKIGSKIFYWKKPKREKRDKGVPQGGILSGMLANLYLHEFDEWVLCVLGKQFDLKYVRYADDFVILTRSMEELPIIHKLVKDQLKNVLKLDLNEDKTHDDVDVHQKGLEFVGFHFDGKHISAREKNVEKFKCRILEILDKVPPDILQKKKPGKTLKYIIRRINYKILGRSGKETCPICGNIRQSSPRSWMTFFCVVTDIGQLKQLDKWIRNTIYDYAYQHYKIRVSRKYLRQQHLRCLVNERFSINCETLIPCSCDIEKNGVWFFAKHLFRGKIFNTLDLQRPFKVEQIDDNSISIKIQQQSYQVAKEVFTQSYERIKQGPVSRAQMDRFVKRENGKRRAGRTAAIGGSSWEKSRV